MPERDQLRIPAGLTTVLVFLATILVVLTVLVIVAAVT